MSICSWFRRFRSPRAELRGLWVPHWDLTSAGRIRAVVEQARRANLNCLLVQVVARGDAYCQSERLPRAEALAGSSLDPLAEVLDAARLAGLQVHAWVNALLVWTAPQRPTSPRHVLHAHPDWLMVDPYGQTQGPGVAEPGRSYEAGWFLDPGVPAVQEHLEAICGELLARYPVAGLHLDFIRHPNRVGTHATRLSYTPASLRWFRAEFPHLDPAGGRLEHTAAWDQWREDQVTAVVRAAVRAVRRGPRPGARLSAAVMARWDIAQGRLFTSGRSWLEQGHLDRVCPMAYFTDTDPVVHYTRAFAAADPAGGARVCTGLGAWLMSPAALVAQIRAARSAGTGGVVLFSSSALTEQHVQALAAPGGPFDRPAGLPALAALPASPAPPAAIPRAPEPVLIGTLEPVGDGVQTVSFHRDFYVRQGRTRLLMENRGIRAIRLLVNRRHTVEVAHNQTEVDLSPFVDPAATRVYPDPHTSTILVEGSGRRGQQASFWVLDRYEA